ncbi:sulfur transferase domain-containing protein [Glaciimonas sp. CA11.2]|uniref:beta-lactamase hydrolase domain-containing protein n=1 Tax=unclassified Glaciimonas TaxID=2644401 RepID=UPI002AB33B32|nr:MULTISPECIES: sulfur transferase domain-containing protein [unclassified Glaciimonas]MDY7548340.1 sulfur transferase domain-containing protein [Glaciimonas sp. CA11.2]MEB0010510.1 sulfur transferase domain-containing protein [Glaciimonas sp. Cout2]MEB0083540.1 sulfur transferase domain-containing protein [Glaciimonas sp. Gout2]MEB0165020.1 sulfur transferase domain-containing protein [Glaciimonas sp. CA11.2]
MSTFKLVANEIYIGPQPNDQDLQDARQQGIRTIIDFREPSETTTSNEILTTNHHLSYVNIPVNKTAPNASQIRDLTDALKNNEGPFLLHCVSGARAALILSLSRAEQHDWNGEQTMLEAKKMGYDLTAFPEFCTFVAQNRN